MCIVTKLTVLLFFICEFRYILGQCAVGSTDTVGLVSLNKNNKDYATEAFNAFVFDDPEYRFDCCGFISTWRIFGRNGATVPTDVHFQVWTNPGAGADWTLRGENVLSVTVTNGDNIIPVTGSRIRAFTNDYIGVYEPNEAILTYGGGSKYRTAIFTTGTTTFDWNTAASGNTRDHSVNADIVGSAAPVITNLDDTVVVSNNEVAGNSLFTLTFSDADPEDDGQLTIAVTTTTGSAGSLFEYDTLSYAVKVNSGVTLTPGDHTMTFTISDPCGQSSTGILTLRIENEAPILTSLATTSSTTISEDLTTETLLHTLEVTDADPYTCQLDSTGVPFEIKTISGSTSYGIFLSDGAAMDYDTRNAYVLDLSCTDTYDVSTGTFTVNLIRNEPPVINGLPLAVDIQEDTVIETTLYTLSVTDPENTAVSCTVASTVPTGTTLLFIKPSANFNEYDIVLQSNPNLQYDVTRTYRLNIDCTDGRRTDSSIFFMNVLRNRPPVFLNLQNITTVSSIASYIGQIVFDVEVTDPENDQITYSMFCVPSTNCPFEIYHSGEILLKRSVEGEFVPAYDLYVYVNDGQSTTGPRSLTVHILDINYVPVIKNLPLPSALVVAENSPLSMSVFQVSIQDNDGADIHTYSMTSDPSDGSNYFVIDSITGLVSTSASTVIDYETVGSTSYTFTIRVSDTKDSASKNLSVTIANENEAPVFTKKSYVLSVNEGSAGTVLANPGYLYTDEDIGDTHTFSMTCGTNVGYFSIASSTGVISLATDLDVDATGSATSFTCTVTVSDGALIDTATLTINVNNINDNTPVFSNNLFTYYLDLNTVVNTVFGSAVATDGDAGAFGTFTYSLDQSALGLDTFGIKANGDLYVKNALTSYGYGQSLTFTALATDTGGLQGTATVFVVIPQTTTVTTTTTDRYYTFWEYPANPAWVIPLILLAIVCCILPVVMIYRNRGSCTWKGRPGKSYNPSEKQSNIDNNDRNRQEGGRFNPKWKPWKWFEIR